MDTFCFGRLPLKYSFHAAMTWSVIWGLVLIVLCIFLGVSDEKHVYASFYLLANFWWMFYAFMLVVFVVDKD